MPSPVSVRGEGGAQSIACISEARVLRSSEGRRFKRGVSSIGDSVQQVAHRTCLQSSGFFCVFRFIEEREFVDVVARVGRQLL